MPPAPSVPPRSSPALSPPVPSAALSAPRQVTAVTVPAGHAAPLPDVDPTAGDWAGTLGNWTGRIAWSVVLPAIALTLMGIYAITTAKPAYGRKQWVWFAVSWVGFAIAVMPHHRRLARLAYVGFAACLVLLVVVLKTAPRGGAHRWIDIGLASLQPSELAKIAFVVALAEWLRFRENYRNFSGLAVPFALALVPMGLIVIEPDLGTTLLFLPTLFAMLYAAGARRKHLLGIVLMGILAMPVFWHVLRDYQRTRIAVLCRQLPDGVRDGIRNTFKLPDDHLLFGAGGMDWRFRTGDGHHLVMSLELIREGRLWGDEEDDPADMGVGRLPENHTDFVFAVWARDTGFLGSALMLATFGWLVWGGLRVGRMTPDPFGRLLAVGIATMIAFQMLVNVGMTVGMAPITGITLPFVSYGGSSLVTSYVMLGLLVNVGMRRPFLLSRPAFEFNEE